MRDFKTKREMLRIKRARSVRRTTHGLSDPGQDDIDGAMVSIIGMSIGDHWVLFTQYPFRRGTKQMVKRKCTCRWENGLNAYHLAGPAVYSPREIAQIVGRVCNGRTERLLLGGDVRHGRKKEEMERGVWRVSVRQIAGRDCRKGKQGEEDGRTVK